MAFKNIVEEAKRNTPQKVFRREEDIKNLIDCTGAHAVHVNSESAVNWEECKFLKKSGQQNFCTEYLCYCTGDKCNKPTK